MSSCTEAVRTESSVKEFPDLFAAFEAAARKWAEHANVEERRQFLQMGLDTGLFSAWDHFASFCEVVLEVALNRGEVTREEIAARWKD